MTLCAELSGADTVEAIAIYVIEKKDWIKEFLGLSKDVPSYNTFWWKFVLIKPTDTSGVFHTMGQGNCSIITDESIDQLNLKSCDLSQLKKAEMLADRILCVPARDEAYLYMIRVLLAQEKISFEDVLRLGKKIHS